MRFALAGNPNCGKTTLFNHLTGSTAHVGNWAGVTVERKEGIYKKNGSPVTIIDLPGIYSLSPYTPEEVVARNYIIDETPDLIINIVDASNIERNLYLTTQLLETDTPIIVALNMIDVVERDGTSIDIDLLGKQFGVPVTAISALHETGIDELMGKAREAAGNKRNGKTVLNSTYLAPAYDCLFDAINEIDASHPVFHAVKLLEGDELEQWHLNHTPETVAKARSLVRLKPALNGDFEAAVADARYTFITSCLKESMKKTSSTEISRSDRIDSVFTHKIFGIPIFMIFMFAIFHFTFGSNFLFVTGLESPGVFLQSLMITVFDWVSSGTRLGLESFGASDWIVGLVVDGIIAGISGVLSFLPQIALLFLFLSVMEDSGYMARAAFLMDRVLINFGLSGKAFMPLLMCFGCLVPAMMVTRTLDSEKERKLTILLTPFFSCGAKLPIWAMITSVVFPENADLVVFGIYFLGIFTAIFTAVLLSRTILKTVKTPFIMELPAYHMPQAKNLAIHIWQKLKGFILRAAFLITSATIIIWLLGNFSFSLKQVGALEADSMLGIIGNMVKPIFVPLGFASGQDGWKSVVAIFTGLIAREMVVSSLNVLYNSDISFFTQASAMSFMAFNLLSIPCAAAVSTAHAELRDKKWTLFAIVFWLVTSWIVSYLIFNFILLIGG